MGENRAKDNIVLNFGQNDPLISLWVFLNKLFCATIRDKGGKKNLDIHLWKQTRLELD